MLDKVLLKKYSTPHVKVYVIPQGEIIKHIGVQFVGGRHFLVDPKIPDGEVWIAKELMTSQEGLYFLYHELYEMNKMADGMKYDDAHTLANRVEGKARNEHKDDIDRLIDLEKKRYEDRIIEKSHFNGTLALHQDNKLHHQHHREINHNKMNRDKRRKDIHSLTVSR